MLSHDSSIDASSPGLSPTSLKMLKTASMWARFIAIFGLLNIVWGIISFFISVDGITMPSPSEFRMAYNFLGFFLIMSVVVFLVAFGLQIYYYIQTLQFGNHADKASKLNDTYSIFPAFRHLANSFWAMALICIIIAVYLILVVIYVYQKFWMFL